MNQQPPKRTETATLRPWTDSTADIASILEAFDTDDMAGQAGEPINGVEAARRWVAPWLEREPRSGIALAIDVNGRAVGNVMATAIDRRHETAWVSYWVSPDARGGGLASAAALPRRQLQDWQIIVSRNWSSFAWSSLTGSTTRGPAGSR